MPNIEFDAYVQEDGTIAVPFDFIGQMVRIILMPQTKDEPIGPVDSSYFTSFGIDTKGYKFCREEANARR
ncbi:MAG: hypothetical protein LBE35_01520 [Clostridiales bacterium]|jgi:hypothetical protein|nr:hypothetical protein [Clostridiales bacterium]